MSTFVLVHGAFRGGWSWRYVAQQLRAAGNEVYAPSLTGMGDRAHLADRPIDLTVWIDDVSRLLTYEDLHDVVLVGHSQGGLVTTAVSGSSAAAASRIARLDFIDAPVPADGQRGVDLNPPGVPPPPDGIDLDMWLPPRPVNADDGYSADIVDWINGRLTPTPIRPSFDVVRLDASLRTAIPRRYAFCAETPTNYPCWYTRLALEENSTPYTVFESGHDVALTHPQLVADWLLA
jgi:pimeloyl-ACP methyl ester carboxylesterase